MLIYELEIGFKSNNILQVEVECVDEADADRTFFDLINDMAVTMSEQTHILEHDNGVAAFMIKDVEYVRWEWLKDTSIEVRSRNSSWDGCTTYSYNPMSYNMNETKVAALLGIKE